MITINYTEDDYAEAEKAWTSKGTFKLVGPNSVQYIKDGQYHREDGPAVEIFYDSKVYHKGWAINGEFLDTYSHLNFDEDFIDVKTREQALAVLYSKERPISYDLYMADIDELYPEDNKGE